MKRAEAWAHEQETEGLRHEIDVLRIENKRVKRERDEAVVARFADQEEAAGARNKIASKDAEIGRLESLMDGLMGRLENAEGSQQQVSMTELELLRIRQKLSALISTTEVLQQSSKGLSRENEAIHAQVVSLQGIREERNDLAEKNKYLLSRNKLLTSQVGNFMVGGKIGRTYYVLQALSNFPLIGGIIRRTSEELYDSSRPREKRGNK